MGCIFSCFKNNNGSTESLLFATNYCYICDKQYTFNEYNRHIVECNKDNSFSNQFTEKNIKRGNIDKKNGDL